MPRIQNRRRRFAATLLAGLIAPFAHHTAFAAPEIGDITVTSTTDFDDPDDPPNGICTLREAINNADNHTQWNKNPDCASGGTLRTIIRFGTTKQTPEVPVTKVSISPKFGEISVNSTIRMLGPVTISGPLGKLKSRLFYIAANGDLTTTNVSFDNGVAVAESGGALLVDGALTMIGGSISSCSADRGGAIAVNGSALIANVDIRANKANVEGGGIWASSTAPVGLAGSTIELNTANGPGGGLFQQHGTGVLSIARTYLYGNRAKGPLGDGGALYAGGEVSIDDSVIARNEADGALGGAGLHFPAGTAVTIERTELTDNSLAGFTPSAMGGAIHHAGGGSVTLRAVNVTKNQAWVGGGAYFGPGAIVGIINSTLAFNTADAAALPARDDAGAGAAVFADDAFVSLHGVTIRDNSGITQLTASGPGSTIEFANSIAWTLTGVRNCDGDGTFLEIAASAQNVDWVGGSCPTQLLKQPASAIFAPKFTFIAPVSPPTAILHHITWPPLGPLIGAGDPAECIDTSTIANRDELDHPRTTCNIGAVEK